MEFNCLKATEALREDSLLFTAKSPGVPCVHLDSFDQPQKDEKLSQLWNHPMVLNLGLPDWDSSILTIRPLLHNH